MTNPIPCPHCRNPIAIKDPRPGRFRIKCPECEQAFVLTMPEGPDAVPVTTIPEASAKPAPAAVPAFDPDETVEAAARPRVARGPAKVEESTIEVSTSTRPVPEAGFQPPRSMGGYRVGAASGLTRSGARFRARRWPFGGPSALAVARPRWAADARFVARFAREAFASVPLRHPNLVEGRAVGIDGGLPFLASDAPGGFPLSDPSRGRSGLDRDARASAILHAARGLRHAHEQGVYHRGITLDDIFVDDSGMVRLAGLGVGLTPDTPEVPAIAAVELAGPSGSPASPTPEPPSAASAREDVAALGRALQTLVGGPEGARAVPPGLAGVARRMAGEGDEPRYPDLGAAVRALESELGVAGPFAPSEAEAAAFEEAAREFDEPPLARVRPPIAMGAAGLGGLLAATGLLARMPLFVMGVVAFGLLVWWSLVKVRGILGDDPVFGRARELALGGTRGDWLTLAAGAALVVGALWATGLLGMWILLGLAAGGLAGAYHFAIDRPIAAARVGAIAKARALLMGLRRRGVDEDDVRRFAARQPGAKWEEFFEALFGYDAMRDARRRWGLDAGGKRRPRFAPWRDPIADVLDAKLVARRDERHQVLLQGTEERGAEARGINLLTARRKGRRVAEAMVMLAGQYRRSLDGSVGLPLMNAILRATERPEEFLAAAEAIEGPSGPPAWREALGMAVRVAFGPRARFLLGGVMLAGFLVWLHQNELIDAEEIRRDVLAATSDREQAVLNAEKLRKTLASNVQDVADAARGTKSLEVGPISPEVTRRVDGFGLGVAGLILVASSFFGSVRIAAFAVPGALVAAFGPRLVDATARPLGPTSLMAMAIGVGLFALGMVFGRGRG